MYRHILATVDLLDSDIKVLQTAETLAHFFSSKLSAVHICQSHVTGYGEETSHHHIFNEMQIKQHCYPKLKKMVVTCLADKHHCDVFTVRISD